MNSLAFYPDELILASGSEDNTTKIWRQSPNLTWNCVATLDDTGNGKSLAFHPKKLFLATGSDDISNINIWQFDKTSNRTILNQEIRQDEEVTSFNFHPKEAILAIAFDAKIKLVSLIENSNSQNRPNSGSENKNGNGFDPTAPYNQFGMPRLGHPYYLGGGLQNLENNKQEDQKIKLLLLFRRYVIKIIKKANALINLLFKKLHVEVIKRFITTKEKE